MPKHKPKDELKDIVYIDHYFNDWEADTKNLSFAQEGIYSRLRTLYFANAEKNNGKIANDFELLCFRIGCHTDDERADLAWVLKDKFKMINKSYRHKMWDKHIKNIRFKIGKDSNTGENRNAKSNSGNGGGVTLSNGKSNDDRNTNIYDNTGGFVMTGAERTEKSRKLKTLIKQGVNADKSMSLDEIRVLYDTHFNKNHSPCNATPAPSCNENLDDCNADGNASNAQIRENKSLPNNQESKANECVNQALHTRTHTNFSKNAKSIGDWQQPTLANINHLLSQNGFGRALEQGEYTQMFTKFVNYNVSRELQGVFLATEQVRIDKLIDWIKREKPVFNAVAPTTTDNISEIYIQPKNIDHSAMVWVSGFYKPCFDDYTPAECTKIIKEYRLAGETELEAYERIKSAGVANCQKHEVASPEFVKQILAQYKPSQQQVAK